MQLKILAGGRLNHAINMMDGDKLRLSIFGTVVHTYEPTDSITISGWAFVRLGNNFAYFVGGDSLRDDLKTAGAVEELIPEDQHRSMVKGKTVEVTSSI